MNLKGFTLLELVIVIVIIGILATAFIPQIRWIQNQAKKRAAIIQMQDFNTALVLARVNSFKILKDITGNWCSNCRCRKEAPFNAPEDLRYLPYNHPCRSNRRDALTSISIAAGMDSGSLSSMELDPRGAPYQLDENEGEYSNWLVCRADAFFSLGPDGKLWWWDNISMNSAPAFCPGAY